MRVVKKCGQCPLPTVNLLQTVNLNACNSPLDKFTVSLTVEKDHEVEFLVDSGNTLNILNVKTFQNLNNKNTLEIKKTNVKIST